MSADFNRDGRLDLATAGGVLLGNGDGDFQSASSLPFVGGSWALTIGDFNQDGNPDLAGPTSVLLGNGDGTFGQSLEFGGWAYKLGGGDFKGDGKADLVRTWWENNQDWGVGYIGVLLGNGDGTFASPWLAETTSLGSLSIALADFNSDGTLDVAIPDSGNVAVWLGNGDGTLRLPVSYDAADAGYAAVADFNEDGKLDLGTTGMYPSANVGILVGNGDGTFQPAQVYGRSGFPSVTAVGDFNGDGHADMALDLVSVYLGNGDGTLELPNNFQTGVEARGVTAGDFNSDGFSDLAGSTNTAVIVLVDDASWPPVGAPSVSVSSETFSEGNIGTQAITFTLTLSAAHSQPVTVTYGAGNCSATAGSDYQASSGTLEIPAGQTSGTINVLVNGDRLAEANKTFVVNLSGPINATIADGQGVGTIMDDEPRISINDVTKAEGKRGQTTLFTFTATLSVAYDQAVTMSFRTMDSTATSASGDYITKTGPLIFAPGETTKIITIEVKGDSKMEANETFYLDLYGLSSNGLFTKSRGVGTILSDD